MNTTTDTTPGLLAPPERVLSTLNADGSRRWLRPRLSPGRYLTARRATAYGLIALFTLQPHVRIGGKPAMFLDVAHRQFTLFGYTFLPTDTLLLALLLLSIFVAIFLFTALAGRLFCGWACPQTVYLEFVFRPLERLCEGTRGRGGAPGRPTPVQWLLIKYGLYLLISLFLAHTFLAYFVGVDALAQWVRQSPWEHPGPFAVMFVTTALMMFNFSYFREQTCILACPYGRFQSVLLDRQSLIIGYDARRGEPRGPVRRTAARPVTGPAPEPPALRLATIPPTAARGDCVDCRLCVNTCPTGIDIREGLQLECVGCAQCIDACDAVMDKLGRPRGLIRYTSQARVEGQRGRLLRPRVLLYGLVLTVLVTLLTTALIHKPTVDLTVLRGPGLPFSVLPDGGIANHLRIKLVQRGAAPATYTIRLADPGAARLQLESAELTLQPGEARTISALVVLPRGAFHEGHAETLLVVEDQHGFRREIRQRLLGPRDAAEEGRR